MLSAIQALPGWHNSHCDHTDGQRNLCGYRDFCSHSTNLENKMHKPELQSCQCLKGFAEDGEIQRAFYALEYSESEY